MSWSCWWSGHNWKTVDHTKYPIYKIVCTRCGAIWWDGGFKEIA